MMSLFLLFADYVSFVVPFTPVDATRMTPLQNHII